MHSLKLFRTLQSLEKCFIPPSLLCNSIHNKSNNHKKGYKYNKKSNDIEALQRERTGDTRDILDFTKWNEDKRLEFNEWQEINSRKTNVETSFTDVERVFGKTFVKSNEKDLSKQSAFRVEATVTKNSKSTIILFPGHGTQFAGMVKDSYSIPKVKKMYEKASDLLGYNLYEISSQGNEQKLLEIKYQHPAILMASLAAVEKLRREKPEAIENCVATAGFGVGELTALAFSGALHFLDALRLANLRAVAMQVASDMIPGGMMAVFYGHNTKVKQGCAIAENICRNMGIQNVDCRIANYLYPECKIIAGNLEALRFLETRAEEFGIDKINFLDVPGAFHTPLMNDVCEPLKEAMECVFVNNPKIPVYSNATGKPFRTTNDIRRSIPVSACKPVKWEQTMHVMYEKPKLECDYFPTTYECGPGKSLYMLLKKINAIASEKYVNVSA